MLSRITRRETAIALALGAFVLSSPGPALAKPLIPLGTGPLQTKPYIPPGTGPLHGRPYIPVGTGPLHGKPYIPPGTGPLKPPCDPRVCTPPWAYKRQHHWHGGLGYGVITAAVDEGVCYIVRKRVYNAYGQLVTRKVKVCE